MREIITLTMARMLDGATHELLKLVNASHFVCFLSVCHFSTIISCFVTHFGKKTSMTDQLNWHGSKLLPSGWYFYKNSECSHSWFLYLHIKWTFCLKLLNQPYMIHVLLMLCDSLTVKGMKMMNLTVKSTGIQLLFWETVWKGCNFFFPFR